MGQNAKTTLPEPIPKRFEQENVLETTAAQGHSCQVHLLPQLHKQGFERAHKANVKPKRHNLRWNPGQHIGDELLPHWGPVQFHKFTSLSHGEGVRRLRALQYIHSASAPYSAVQRHLQFDGCLPLVRNPFAQTYTSRNGVEQTPAA